MINWKALLREKKILIADGGWGTELMKRGLEADEVPEFWNLSRREDVQAVARGYVEAGADLILTNTFGGNRLKLNRAGLGQRTVEINRIGAEISREAAGDNILVFGSMGPTGEMMVPLGSLTEADATQCFREQAEALSAAGVDGLVVETMIDLTEAKAALKAIKESTSLPVAVTLTFNKCPSGYATLMGVRPEQAATELERGGADIVGANCGTGIEEMIGVIRSIRGSTALPVWCKPNAGLPELVDGVTVYRETADKMVSHVKALVEAGSNIIGGCCGTTPAHIYLFVSERDRLVRESE